MKRSRLSKRLEKQSQKTFFLSILGIIVVIALIFKFGIPLLINFSMLASGNKNSQDNEKNNSASFVAPPVLDPLFDATHSAQINISGKASPKQTINLYVNDDLNEKTETKEDGSFEFKEISLQTGENKIKTKAITNEKKESDYSNTFTVIFKKDPPSLSIDSPTDGQSFSKDDNSINITGKTDSGSKVTVNGFWAIADSDGKFSYNMRLQDGENSIKVVATDEADNNIEKEIKVKYSP